MGYTGFSLQVSSSRFLPGVRIAEALELISHKIQALLVVERGQVVGIVNFHDLMRIGAF